MSEQPEIAETRAHPARSRRDHGQSFVELLVAIVLLGTAVVGILAAVRATIIGSALERDHARAQQWLQAAGEVLVGDIAWKDCNSTNTGAVLKGLYQTALQGEVDIVPSSWLSSQVSIPVNVTFAQPDGSFSGTCHSQIDRQLIRIQVVGPDNKIIETVDVVKVP